MLKLQPWYIDDGLDIREANQRRINAQRDWELLWDQAFIFAGCNGGIGSDINRLEEIVRAATARLEEYRKRTA